ncbi:hypothetical protein C0J52_10531 [Blattella germanica]|nr:hypothetical protein C0J52_10531 [Blattella germanica]
MSKTNLRLVIQRIDEKFPALKQVIDYLGTLNQKSNEEAVESSPKPKEETYVQVKSEENKEAHKTRKEINVDKQNTSNGHLLVDQEHNYAKLIQKLPSPKASTDVKSKTKKNQTKSSLLKVKDKQNPNNTNNELEKTCVRKRKREEIGQFICDYCGKILPRKRYLIYHFLLHTGERPYSCDICKKSFQVKHHLVSHLLSHNEKRPYGCKYCSKTFKNSSGLKYHIQSHVGTTMRYKCSICNKKFKQSSDLKVHSYVHGKLRPYVCHFCSNRFRHRALLRSHLRCIHAGKENELPEIDWDSKKEKECVRQRCVS